jgi:hypothetical protein
MPVIMVKEFDPPEILMPAEAPDPISSPGELRAYGRSIRSAWAPFDAASIAPPAPMEEREGFGGRAPPPQRPPVLLPMSIVEIDFGHH